MPRAFRLDLKTAPRRHPGFFVLYEPFSLRPRTLALRPSGSIPLILLKVT